jgi:DNA-binding transcriptional MerR regulator
MDYLLEDIVQLSGLSGDTISCYQTLKLIPAPAYKRRKAVYDDRHRDRLCIIRRASDQGFPPLRVTRELLTKHERFGSNRELLASVQKQLAAPCWSIGEAWALCARLRRHQIQCDLS